MKLKQIFNPESEQEDQWISIADMMAGMMVIFLFIALINLKDQLDKLKSFDLLQDRIYNSLKLEFSKDLRKWNAEIEKDTLTVSFREPRIQFNTGSDIVKPEFKIILNDFFPRYLKVLSKYRLSIEELRIEGHTSSKWLGAKNKDEAYIENMKLSQNRSKNVLVYCLQLPIGLNKFWAKDKIIASGLSYSKIIKDNLGRENILLSQRTEFRVKVDSSIILDKLRFYLKK